MTGSRIKHDRKGNNMSDIKLRVLYEPYPRYEVTVPKLGHITAKSFREAIIKMLSNVRMYDDEESILEREEELGRQMTQEELIDMLVSQNGDGCDYIIALENEDTKERYIDSDDVGFEEWSI